MPQLSSDNLIPSKEGPASKLGNGKGPLTAATVAVNDCVVEFRFQSEGFRQIVLRHGLSLLSCLPSTWTWQVCGELRNQRPIRSRQSWTPEWAFLMTRQRFSIQTTLISLRLRKRFAGLAR